VSDDPLSDATDAAQIMAAGVSALPGIPGLAGTVVGAIVNLYSGRRQERALAAVLGVVQLLQVDVAALQRQLDADPVVEATLARAVEAAARTVDTKVGSLIIHAAVRVIQGDATVALAPIDAVAALTTNHLDLLTAIPEQGGPRGMTREALENGLPQHADYLDVLIGQLQANGFIVVDTASYGGRPVYRLSRPALALLGLLDETQRRELSGGDIP
jgi:hypothetical protein